MNPTYTSRNTRDDLAAPQVYSDVGDGYESAMTLNPNYISRNAPKASAAPQAYSEVGDGYESPMTLNPNYVSTKAPETSATLRVYSEVGDGYESPMTLNPSYGSRTATIRRPASVAAEYDSRIIPHPAQNSRSFENSYRVFWNVKAAVPETPSVAVQQGERVFLVPLETSPQSNPRTRGVDLNSAVFAPTGDDSDGDDDDYLQIDDNAFGTSA